MRSNNSKESILTVLFLLLAVGAIVVYFVLPENRMLFYIIGSLAILLRIGQYIARLVGNVRLKKERKEALLKDVPPVTMSNIHNQDKEQRD